MAAKPPAPLSKEQKLTNLWQFTMEGLPNRYNTIFSILTPYEVDVDEEPEKEPTKRKRKAKKKEAELAKDAAADEIKDIIEILS